MEATMLGLEQRPEAVLLADALPEAKVESLRDGAEKFEAVFAALLVQQVTKPSEFGDGLMGSGPGSDVLRGLFEDIISEEFAKAGGLGIADAMEQRLSPEKFTKTTSRIDHGVKP